MKDMKKKIEYAEYMSIGFEFVLSIVIGYAFGYYLDKWLDTKPVFTIFLLICGFASAVRSLYQMAKKLEKSMDDKDPPA